MNNPVYIFFWGFRPPGIKYDRKVYGLFDMLGNVGGLAEVIHIASMGVVYIICQNKLETKYISIFSRNILNPDTDTPDISKN